MKKVFLSILCMTALCAFVACSEDEDYNSRLPIFSEVKLSQDVLLTDMEVRATAVMNSGGNLWYNAEFGWSSNMPSDSTLRNTTTTPSVPSCIFRTPSQPGTYTIKMVAKYSFSGQAGNETKKGGIPNGTAIYTTYPLGGQVELTRDIRVRARQ